MTAANFLSFPNIAIGEEENLVGFQDWIQVFCNFTLEKWNNCLISSV